MTSYYDGETPENSNRPASYAETDTSETSLGKEFLGQKQAHPDQSGFVPMGNGLDAFVARAVLTLRAERTIDAQYFVLHDDLVGRSFIGLLARAADRGVRVRLLIDDYHFAPQRDFDLAAFAAHPNIAIRIINPFSRGAPRAAQIISRFGSVTRRMHNKSFIADNQVAVIGGRNIGNEYFDADPDVAFGDLDVFAIGPVVQEISESFDQYWNSDITYPISKLASRLPSAEEARAIRDELDNYMAENDDSKYANALRNSDLARSFGDDSLRFLWGSARVIADAPEKLTESRERTDLHLSKDMSLLFERAGNEVIIFTPYFIPGDVGVEGLSKLAAKGVKVRILTNSLATNNQSVVHAHYANYRKALLKAGIEVYEARVQSINGEGESKSKVLHAKIFVFDREAVFIGSLNMDPRSWRENTEMGVVIESDELAGGIADWFDNNIEQAAYRLQLRPLQQGGETIVWEHNNDGQPIQLTNEPDTSFRERFWMGVMGLLPIESQL